MMNNFPPLFLLLVYSWARISSASVITSLKDLTLDENNHLSGHWILYPKGRCEDTIQSNWNSLNPELRTLSSIKNDELSSLFFPNFLNNNNCYAVCVERGTPESLLTKPLPEKVYSGDANDSADLSSWMSQECLRIEMGWVSYHPNPVDMFWQRESGELVNVGKLDYGERHTVWQQTTLGDFS